MKAEVGDGEDGAFVRDDILHPEVAGGGLDLVRRGEVYFALRSRSSFLIRSSSLASEARMDLSSSIFFISSSVLGFDLAALEAGELVEAEFEDGVGLALGERVLGHQLQLGLVAIGEARMILTKSSRLSRAMM
jgi:hypothetical protein